MKTADKAATVVAEFLNGNDVAANAITRRLSDAGLLAPDLPEPARRSIEGYHTSHPWAEWDALEATITAVKNGWIAILNADVNIPLTPREARKAAHALLAAANEAEGEQ